MDMREAKFAAELLAIFKVEAGEHLKTISDGLLALESNQLPQVQQEYIETVFREAHSLKGAALSVSLDAVQSLCQSIEDVLEAWKEKKITSSKDLFKVLYDAVDLIGIFLSDLQGDHSEKKLASEAIVQKLEFFVPKQLKEILKPFSKKIKAKQTTQKLVKPVVLTRKKKGQSITTKQGIPKKDVVSNHPTTQRVKEKEPFLEKRQSSGGLTNEKAGEKTIRINASKLDKLFQLVEEMLIIKLTSSQHATNLKSIHNQVLEWEKQWSNIQSEISSYRHFLVSDEPKGFHFAEKFFDFFAWQKTFIKSFKDQISRLTKDASQDSHIAKGMVDTLLEESKKTLMQPFSTLVETFPRMLRDISHRLDKEVELQILGGEIEIDRRILETIKDPLIHLVRNSIDHGIESREERQKRHKPICGILKIIANRIDGNNVELTIADDGAGIDIEKVKEAVLKKGIVSVKELERLSVQDILMLIFQSGISTSAIITDLSGRGLGLGIVSEKVEKLGGKVYVETHPFIGTTFRIIIPSTLATFRGIHIKVEDQDFIVPTHSVKRILRMKPSEVRTVENQSTVFVDGKTLSFISLADLLEIPLSKEKRENRFILVLILKVAEINLAFKIDEVFKEQEVFVKSLGKQLVRVKNIAAATVVEWGKVVPILNAFDLVKSAVKGLSGQRFINAEETDIKAKSILIVEDSVTARILLKNILESAGYYVKTSVDGVEAFDVLMKEPVDLLLSDVEMPRLDGFELTEKVRKTEKLKDLPVVLCTSRGSREDREHGIEVGANAYLDKSSFAQSNLLEIIKKLL